MNISKILVLQNPRYIQTNFSLGVDVWVESTSSPVCCSCNDGGCLPRIVLKSSANFLSVSCEMHTSAKLDCKLGMDQHNSYVSWCATNLKEAELVRGVWGTDDDCFHVANIDITTSDGKG
jgi:hypothetical protein